MTRFLVGVRQQLARSAMPACLVACLLLHARVGTAGELIGLPTRGHETQAIFIDQASPAPAWVVVLFAGDNGAVALADGGPTSLKGNFLVRSAPYWVAKGDAFAIVDTPSDQPGGMNDAFRLGEAHAADVHAIVAFLRLRYPAAKIALVGTSRGTISVGNVLKREPGLADAYVMTSPMTIGMSGAAGLSGMHWDIGNTLALGVSNENNGCRVSPFGAAKALANDNKMQFLSVSSSQRGGARANECGALSPHGFLGIENGTLESLSRWLDDPGSVSATSR
jgi:hypothetical protein